MTLAPTLLMRRGIAWPTVLAWVAVAGVLWAIAGALLWRGAQGDRPTTDAAATALAFDPVAIRLIEWARGPGQPVRFERDNAGRWWAQWPAVRTGEGDAPDVRWPADERRIRALLRVVTTSDARASNTQASGGRTAAGRDAFAPAASVRLHHTDGDAIELALSPTRLGGRAEGRVTRGDGPAIDCTVDAVVARWLVDGHPSGWLTTLLAAPDGNARTVGFEVRNGTGGVTLGLERRGGVWHMTAPVRTPAHEANAAALLALLATLATEEPPTPETDPARAGEGSWPVTLVAVDERGVPDGSGAVTQRRTARVVELSPEPTGSLRYRSSVREVAGAGALGPVVMGPVGGGVWLSEAQREALEAPWTTFVRPFALAVPAASVGSVELRSERGRLRLERTPGGWMAAGGDGADVDGARPDEGGLTELDVAGGRAWEALVALLAEGAPVSVSGLDGPADGALGDGVIEAVVMAVGGGEAETVRAQLGATRSGQRVLVVDSGAIRRVYAEGAGERGLAWVLGRLAAAGAGAVEEGGAEPADPLGVGESVDGG